MNFISINDLNGNITFLSPYYGNSFWEGAITSLDYNGNIRWIDTLNENNFSAMMDYGPVCDKEGKIYCGSNLEGGYFYCIDSNGVVLWKHIFPNEYDSCPAIAPDGTMYIGLQKGDYNFNQTQTLFAINDTTTDIKDERVEEVKDYQLIQNFPNPFNPATTITYNIPKAGNVSVKVYDVLGRKVTTLVNGFRDAGKYEAIFNASKLSNGIYIYQLRSGEYISNKKMILLK